MAKKAAKKKAAKKAAKKATKKAAKRKPSALRSAEARVTGLKLAVQAQELVQRARASMARSAPDACKRALTRASSALQRAIRACD